MIDRYKRNCDWYVYDERGNSYGNYHPSMLAVLQDIRRELSRIGEVVRCHNAVRIPRILDAIYLNTRKPKPKTKAKKVKRKARK